jgi:hypothetical protein
MGRLVFHRVPLLPPYTVRRDASTPPEWLNVSGKVSRRGRNVAGFVRQAILPAAAFQADLVGHALEELAKITVAALLSAKRKAQKMFEVGADSQ